MSLKIEAIAGPFQVGEGPFWDEGQQLLYFVDILGHTIHSYDPKSNKHNVVEIESGGKPVSLILKVYGENNKFVISIKNSLATVLWDGVSSIPLKPEPFLDIESNESSTRLNDGKCDPSNRLWLGTMGASLGNGQYELGKGKLYSLDQGKIVKNHAANIGISNGLAWSADKKKFFYIDSLTYNVKGYDYDDKTGTLSNERTVFCFKENNIEGFPDGMTIDEEGMLWVACFNGAQVIRVHPNEGKLLQTVKMPSLQITSVTFGGQNLEDLYVTSAKTTDFTKELEEKYPLAGYTFRVTGLGVKGTLSVPIKL